MLTFVVLRTVLIGHNARSLNKTVHHELSTYRINATSRNNTLIIGGTHSHYSTRVIKVSDSEDDLVAPTTSTTIVLPAIETKKSIEHDARTINTSSEFDNEERKTVRAMMSKDRIMVSTEVVVTKEYGTLDKHSYLQFDVMSGTLR